MSSKILPDALIKRMPLGCLTGLLPPRGQELTPVQTAILLRGCIRNYPEYTTFAGATVQAQVDARGGGNELLPLFAAGAGVATGGPSAGSGATTRAIRARRPSVAATVSRAARTAGPTTSTGTT